MSNDSSVLPKLPGRTPVDGLARRVTSKGVHHDLSLGDGESSTPLPVFKFYGRRADDLTGRKYGLLTVVGYAAVDTNYRGPNEKPKPQSSKGALWVVRCVCGVYHRRRTKTLKKSDKTAACSRCHDKGITTPK